MALIKSISGIRGTIGGKPGDGLSPVDVVKFTAAYGTWLKQRHGNKKLNVVVGRDGRKSGSMVNSLVTATLQGLGINVTNLGMATTPTVEIAVTGTASDGGIIITASHNPAEWNALKLLTEAADRNSPASVRSFKAFHSAGLWLAVIIMPPSAIEPVTAISTVGVVAIPRSVTLMPRPCSVVVTKLFTMLPDFRPSRPTITLSFLLPRRCFNHVP
jgi:hypothetical protein